MKEFNLSEKEVDNYNGIDMGSEFFFKEDVKEFIRLLKWKIKECSRCREYPQVTFWIDKLAGEDLKWTKSKN